jgi:hypothetical protein
VRTPVDRSQEEPSSVECNCVIKCGGFGVGARGPGPSSKCAKCVLQSTSTIARPTIRQSRPSNHADARHSPCRTRTRLEHRLPLQWRLRASYDVWGQLAWIVRKVSEVDITESDRALGGRRVACSGMAGIERIDGRLYAATTCDDRACAAIPINMPSDAYGMQVQMNCI